MGLAKINAMGSVDISAILKDWPSEPGRVQVRVVQTEEGRSILQVRLEMGIIQMERDGRPDGRVGFDAVLQLRDAAQAEPLSAEACAAIREEANQFHQRAVALVAVEDFARSVADSRHAMEAAVLMRDKAQRPEDRAAGAAPIPALIVLRSRAEASGALRVRDTRTAIAAIDAGLIELRSVFHDRGGLAAFERSGEAAVLRAMREMLVPRLPSSQRAELEERLKAAVMAENYELAAILRNELRQIRE